jgi:hypothetical protein
MDVTVVQWNLLALPRWPFLQMRVHWRHHHNSRQSRHFHSQVSPQ